MTLVRKARAKQMTMDRGRPLVLRGAWQPLACPVNQTCIGGVCTGACGPGQMRCGWSQSVPQETPK
jgi:hypothetical protein